MRYAQAQQNMAHDAHLNTTMLQQCAISNDPIKTVAY